MNTVPPFLRGAPAQSYGSRESAYVNLTRKLLYSRGGRVSVARAVLYVQLSADDALNGCMHPGGFVSLDSSAIEHANGENSSATRILSVMVVNQHAEHMPISLRITPFGVSRPYIVRKNLDLEDVNVELMPGGRVYVDVPRKISFCSADAINFNPNAVMCTEFEEDEDLIVTPLKHGRPRGAESAQEPLVLPASYPYATLIRAVARAQSVEALPPLEKASLSDEAVPYEPQYDGHLWIYDEPDRLRNAATFIARHLAPAVSLLHTSTDGFTVSSFDGQPWSRALASQPTNSPVHVELDLLVWFVSLPQKKDGGR